TSASSAGAADETRCLEGRASQLKDEDNSERNFTDANEMLELKKQQKQEQQQIIKISLPTNRTPSPAVVHKTDSFADEYESDCEYSTGRPRETVANTIPSFASIRGASRPSSSVGFSQQHPSSSSSASLTGGGVVRRTRRSTVPERPNYSLNLWSIMKNCIGRELTKIPMPVNFSEPLSMLQRITEELEYSHCLDKAARASDQWSSWRMLPPILLVRIRLRLRERLNRLILCLGRRSNSIGLRIWAGDPLAEQAITRTAAAFHASRAKRAGSPTQEFGMSASFAANSCQSYRMASAHLVFASPGINYTLAGAALQPTDSRLRPDQALNGGRPSWDEAIKRNSGLRRKPAAKRRQRESQWRQQADAESTVASWRMRREQLAGQLAWPQSFERGVVQSSCSRNEDHWQTANSPLHCELLGIKGGERIGQSVRDLY
uniref:F-box domain-containing protein n=1 Tax=Macrostomum lignano TaxID=282301 RepID=A0A1I8F4G5_9PLAT